MEALRRFRTIKAKRPMWIDSICINNDDPIERTEQVRLMGEVYGLAKEVPIWLGEKTDGVDTALKLVSKIIEAFTTWYDSQHGNTFQSQWEEIKRQARETPDALDQAEFWKLLQSEECLPFFDGIDLRNLDIPTYQMPWWFLRNLLKRRWFRRVWTWQEKELAKSATLYIGDRTLSWSRLRFAMLLVMAHDLSETRATPFPAMPGREYLHVLDSLSVSSSLDLLDIVINVRHRETKLKQDKIFAVLAAAARYKSERPDDVEHFSRLVNYGGLNVQELYKEFSRYWIMERGDLRVLQACNPSKKKIEELPSWVVDWSDTTPSHQLSSKIYTASKGREDVIMKYDYQKSNELHLGGVAIDKVAFVFNRDSMDENERYHTTPTADWDYWRARLVQPLMSLYVAGMNKKFIGALPADWQEVVEEMEWDEPYEPTGQPMAEAFWRTLLSDQNPYITNASDKRIPFNVRTTPIFHRWAHRRALSRGFLRKTMRTRKDVNVTTQRWLEALHLSVLYKRFFITETGLIGLAPNNIQAGDHVCVFFGGRVPFSLRDHGDYFTLVEETYLHGFMDGEAIELMERGEREETSFCIR